MRDEVRDGEQASALAREYADDDCVGELGEVLDVRREDGVWIVEFRTHTFADQFDHRVRITAAVGNVISHERCDQPSST